jgi:hypothetical protein
MEIGAPDKPQELLNSPARGQMGRRVSQPSPSLSLVKDLFISSIALTTMPAAGQLSRTNTTTKQTNSTHRMTTVLAQLLCLGQLKQNSIKAVSEQYQTKL